MSSRLDIVIFGASGFTGACVVKEICRLTKNGTLDITWGIAGRSREKLLKVINNETGIDTSSIPIIVADVSDENSLNELCSKAKVIVNCIGPFILYGENVVKACLQQKTHYVDITGEPLFMESIYVKYNNEAEKVGIYIISSCGYDSIPADMGVVYFCKNFKGIVNDIELYITLEYGDSKSIMNYATWESLVHGFKNIESLKNVRKTIFPKKHDLSPRIQKRSLIHKNKEINGWSLPFFGSDRSVIKRSQYRFHEHYDSRPIQIESYMTNKSLLGVFGTILASSMIVLLVKIKLGRKLLLKYPELFTFGLLTRENPSEETMEKCVSNMTLIGKGWENGDDIKNVLPTKKMNVHITCKNPCYGSTSTMVLMSALMIIKEKENMPKNGGVLTPAFAFSKTSLIEKLQENGVNFEVKYVENNFKSKL